MKFLRFSFAVLVFSALALPAQAAEINKEGAARLKKVIETYIGEQKKLSEIDGQTKVNYQGNVMVEEAKDYYAVTLPYTKIIRPGGNQVDIGMVSINASPGDTPTQWKMRVAVPTPIITTDSTGREIARITIGGQRAAGIWDEELQTFTKLDALYTDLLFSSAAGSLKISETKIVSNLTKDTAGKWSGPGTVELKNVNAESRLKGGSFQAQNIKLSFAIDQYNTAAISDYREKIVALAENASITKQPVIVSPQHATAFTNLLTDFLVSAGNGMKFSYDFSGVTLTRPQSAKNPAQTMKIASSSMGMDIGGLTTGKVRLALKASHHGLTITPPVPESAFTPTDSNIDIAFENIPIREIVDLGKNTLESFSQQPEMKQLAGISFLMKVPALLSQSGTFMTITDTHIGNPDIDIKIESQIRADISAVNSATGDGKITIRGLDQLVTQLKNREKEASGSDLQKIRGSIQQLEMLKENAKVETTPDGKTLYVIEMQMTPQGQILLNGKDALKTKAAAGKPAKIPAPALP